MSRLNLISATSLLRNVCSAIKPTSSSVVARRLYCQSAKDLQSKVTASQTSFGRQFFRNETKPSDFDKKMLLWSGRYKKAEDIPEYVSCDAISHSRSSLRVKICMAMIAATLVGCVFMVISGKKALKEEKSLVNLNMERKFRLKQEAEREKAQAGTLNNH